MRIAACFLIAIAGLIASDALLHLDHGKSPQVPSAPIQVTATE